MLGPQPFRPQCILPALRQVHILALPSSIDLWCTIIRTEHQDDHHLVPRYPHDEKNEEVKTKEKKKDETSGVGEEGPPISISFTRPPSPPVSSSKETSLIKNDTEREVKEQTPDVEADQKHPCEAPSSPEDQHTSSASLLPSVEPPLLQEAEVTTTTLRERPPLTVSNLLVSRTSLEAPLPSSSISSWDPTSTTMTALDPVTSSCSSFITTTATTEPTEISLAVAEGEPLPHVPHTMEKKRHQKDVPSGNEDATASVGEMEASLDTSASPFPAKDFSSSASSPATTRSSSWCAAFPFSYSFWTSGIFFEIHRPRPSHRKKRSSRSTGTQKNKKEMDIKKLRKRKKTKPQEEEDVEDGSNVSSLSECEVLYRSPLRRYTAQPSWTLPPHFWNLSSPSSSSCCCCGRGKEEDTLPYAFYNQEEWTETKTRISPRTPFREENIKEEDDATSSYSSSLERSTDETEELEEPFLTLPKSLRYFPNGPSWRRSSGVVISGGTTQNPSKNKRKYAPHYHFRSPLVNKQQRRMSRCPLKHQRGPSPKIQEEQEDVEADDRNERIHLVFFGVKSIPVPATRLAMGHASTSKGAQQEDSMEYQPEEAERFTPNTTDESFSSSLSKETQEGVDTSSFFSSVSHPIPIWCVSLHPLDFSLLASTDGTSSSTALRTASSLLLSAPLPGTTSSSSSSSSSFSSTPCGVEVISLEYHPHSIEEKKKKDEEKKGRESLPHYHHQEDEKTVEKDFLHPPTRTSQSVLTTGRWSYSFRCYLFLPSARATPLPPGIRVILGYGGTTSSPPLTARGMAPPLFFTSSFRRRDERMRRKDENGPPAYYLTSTRVAALPFLDLSKGTNLVSSSSSTSFPTSWIRTSTLWTSITRGGVVPISPSPSYRGTPRHGNLWCVRGLWEEGLWKWHGKRSTHHTTSTTTTTFSKRMLSTKKEDVEEEEPRRIAKRQAWSKWLEVVVLSSHPSVPSAPSCTPGGPGAWESSSTPPLPSTSSGVSIPITTTTTTTSAVVSSSLCTPGMTSFMTPSSASFSSSSAVSFTFPSSFSWILFSSTEMRRGPSNSSSSSSPSLLNRVSNEDNRSHPISSSSLTLTTPRYITFEEVFQRVSAGVFTKVLHSIESYWEEREAVAYEASLTHHYLCSSPPRDDDGRGFSSRPRHSTRCGSEGRASTASPRDRTSTSPEKKKVDPPPYSTTTVSSSAASSLLERLPPLPPPPPSPLPSPEPSPHFWSSMSLEDCKALLRTRLAESQQRQAKLKEILSLLPSFSPAPPPSSHTEEPNDTSLTLKGYPISKKEEENHIKDVSTSQNEMEPEELGLSVRASPLSSTLPTWKTTTLSQNNNPPPPADTIPNEAEAEAKRRSAMKTSSRDVPAVAIASLDAPLISSRLTTDWSTSKRWWSSTRRALVRELARNFFPLSFSSHYRILPRRTHGTRHEPSPPPPSQLKKLTTTTTRVMGKEEEVVDEVEPKWESKGATTPASHRAHREAAKDCIAHYPLPCLPSWSILFSLATAVTEEEEEEKEKRVADAMGGREGGVRPMMAAPPSLVSSSSLVSRLPGGSTSGTTQGCAPSLPLSTSSSSLSHPSLPRSGFISQEMAMRDVQGLPSESTEEQREKKEKEKENEEQKEEKEEEDPPGVESPFSSVSSSVASFPRRTMATSFRPFSSVYHPEGGGGGGGAGSRVRIAPLHVEDNEERGGKRGIDRSTWRATSGAEVTSSSSSSSLGWHSTLFFPEEESEFVDERVGLEKWCAAVIQLAQLYHITLPYPMVQGGGGGGPGTVVFLSPENWRCSAFHEALYDPPLFPFPFSSLSKTTKNTTTPTTEHAASSSSSPPPHPTNTSRTRRGGGEWPFHSSLVSTLASMGPLYVCGVPEKMPGLIRLARSGASLKAFYMGSSTRSTRHRSNRHTSPNMTNTSRRIGGGGEGWRGESAVQKAPRETRVFRRTTITGEEMELQRILLARVLLLENIRVLGSGMGVSEEILTSCDTRLAALLDTLFKAAA